MTRALSSCARWRVALLTMALGAIALLDMTTLAAAAETAIVATVPATPTAGTSGIFDVGAALGVLGPYVNSIVGAIISLLIGWATWLIKTKTSLTIDAEHRNALTSWAQRQASAIVAQGLVSVSGLKVSVGSAVIADLANAAVQHIPGALKGLGLTPEEAANRVVDWLPHVPTVAVATAAQMPPKAA